MKKVVKIILVLVVLVFVMASCTQHLCPAYTNSDAQDNVENTNG